MYTAIMYLRDVAIYQVIPGCHIYRITGGLDENSYRGTFQDALVELILLKMTGQGMKQI